MDTLSRLSTKHLTAKNVEGKEKMCNMEDVDTTTQEEIATKETKEEVKPIASESNDKFAEAVEKFMSKIMNFSFFQGDSSSMSASLREIGGELMIVSQFTLSAVTHKGNKPSFHRAASTEKANYLYGLLIDRLNECPMHCQSGVFGSDMDIH